jgi:hypothetical protein
MTSGDAYSVIFEVEGRVWGGGDALVKLSCKMLCVAHCNCVDVKPFFFPALVRRRLLSDEEAG